MCGQTGVVVPGPIRESHAFRSDPGWFNETSLNLCEFQQQLLGLTLLVSAGEAGDFHNRLLSQTA